ncbi:hypothetical protein GpartN1_g6036.t1 [Galdieria partita]|uniref:Uncharacterized protein n=1 Tax=Galdieria partita TaxID=83374 RepID=A0A9C7UT96_9RHOD|nr:hypothetical protein GpartN1_g6036.t1 [Galdieria partita]
MELANFQRETRPVGVRGRLVFACEASKYYNMSSIATVVPREHLQLNFRKAFQGATVMFPIFGALLPIFFGGVFMYLGLTRYSQNMKYYNIHISKKRSIVIRKPRPQNSTDFSLQAVVEDPSVVFIYHPKWQKY